MSINVVNQKLVGSTVVVSAVSMPGPGTLAIFASDADGKLAFPPIGFISLQPGEYRDVIVNLTSQPKVGDVLWAVLEKPGSYIDPYLAADGKPIAPTFIVL